MSAPLKSAGFVIYKHRGATAKECTIVKRVTQSEINTPEGHKTYMIRGFLLRQCECGKGQYGESVRGRFKQEETCGSKCRSSKGPVCECSCSGANHGSNY